MKAPSDLSLVPVHDDEIAREDILLGRGGRTNHHPGNSTYLKIIEERQVEYMHLGSRAAKTAYAMQLVRDLRKKGIRFLKRDPSRAKMWKDVGDSKMREKVSQNLREHQPELKKQLAEEMEQQRLLEDKLQENGDAPKAEKSSEVVAEKNEWVLWETEQLNELGKPYAHPPPACIQTNDEPSHYLVGLQHDDECDRDSSRLDFPIHFPNHSVDAGLSTERLSHQDLDSIPFGDFDPIPLDEALGAAAVEDLWTPCTVDALRKRSFGEPEQVSVHKRSKRSRRTASYQEQTAAPYDSASQYPAFEPPPVNESQEQSGPRGPFVLPSTRDTMVEEFLPPTEATEADNDPLLGLSLLESFGDDEFTNPTKRR